MLGRDDSLIEVLKARITVSSSHGGGRRPVEEVLRSRGEVQVMPITGFPYSGGGEQTEMGAYSSVRLRSDWVI